MHTRSAYILCNHASTHPLLIPSANKCFFSFSFFSFFYQWLIEFLSRLVRPVHLWWWRSSCFSPLDPVRAAFVQAKSLTKHAFHLSCVHFSRCRVDYGAARDWFLEEYDGSAVSPAAGFQGKAVLPERDLALPLARAGSRSLSRVYCSLLGSRSSCWWTAAYTPHLRWILSADATNAISVY